MRIQWKRFLSLALTAVMLLLLLSGCGQVVQKDISTAEEKEAAASESEDTPKSVDIKEEAEALAETAASTAPMTLIPAAPGTLVQKNSNASIDYSNTADGYVMVRYTASSTKKIKAQVTGPSGTVYTYNLTPGSAAWTTFPLSDGNGGYKVTVYQNVSGTKYAAVLSATFTATMGNPFAPFLYPNQYVNYAQNATKTIAKAEALCNGLTDPLDKVKAVYQFVVTNLTYDKEKAATVKSGYLPALDTVLTTKKGICFDYAALMTAMLRSQGVPCKLVIGYAGTAYHAWISVYSEQSGWIDSVIYFDGTTWKRMDPTFASSGKQSSSIMKYIGNGSHYTAKYIY